MPLCQLSLNQLAVFESAEIELKSGLTILAGEAGSGKSLLIEAIDWLLGAPLSPKELIRTGAKQGRIEGVFQLDSPPAWLQDWMESNGIELEHSLADGEPLELCLSRELSASSSRCRVNGYLVSRQALEPLRSLLIESQNQHANTRLFKKTVQRQILDSLGDETLDPLKQRIKSLYSDWKRLQQQWEQWDQQRHDRQQRLEFLRFQLQELEAVAPQDPQEDETCRQELDRLSQSESLQKAYGECIALLSGDSTSAKGSGWGRSAGSEGVLGALADSRKALSQASAMDARAEDLLAQLDTNFEALKTLSTQVEDLAFDLDASPERLDYLVERLDHLDKVKRRYGPTLAEVIAHWETLANELSEHEEQEANPEALKQAMETAERDLGAVLSQLSSIRRGLASQLAGDLITQLRPMALPDAVFEVQLTPTGWTPDGADEVEFLFSANPGDPPRPLAKVASGGELSRVLLALTTISAEAESQPKLFIFDEIDTGTSGQVARSMAEQLRQLSRRGHQLLVITHQPLVAAVGDQGILVEKQTHLDSDTQENRNVSKIRVLESQEEKQQLISQLASGRLDEEASLEFAAHLLKG